METSTGIPTSEPSTVAFSHRVIVASILIASAFIGLFGNTLVIISVVITKKLRTITNVLVVNLAFADFLTCSCIPFQVVGLLSPTISYPLHEIVCAIVAGVIQTSSFCSVLTLVAIAWLRWYVITRSVRGQQGIQTPKKVAIMVVVIWILSIGCMIAPYLGIGTTLGYSVYYGICALTDTNPMEFYWVLFEGIFAAVVLMLTLTFYTLIRRHVLRHNKKFRDNFAIDKDASSSSTTKSRQPMIKAINRKEVEITKNLFMVVCVCFFCLLATSVNFLIPGSSVVTLYSIMIFFINSVVNPIIYGLKHPNFQDVFKRLFCCCRVPPKQVST